MTISPIVAEIAALQETSTDDLRRRWAVLFGRPAPAYGRGFLLERLSYRIQELRRGGLDSRVRGVMDKLLDAAGYDETGRSPRRKPKRRSATRGGRDPAALLPGTLLVRHWRGRTYEVEVLDGGYKFAGQRYRSLSAIANAITGSHRNGRAFFGVGRKSGAASCKSGAASCKTDLAGGGPVAK